MTVKQRSEQERIDTVADLVVGDRVRVGDRSKPFVVQEVGARTVQTYDGDRIVQHAVELEGDWEGAKTYVVADVVNPLTGETPGTQRYFGDVPAGETGDVDVRLVEEDA